MIMIIIISTIIIGIISYIAWKLFKQTKELEDELKKSNSKIKSLFVLHGHAVEKLAPFSKKFGGDMREITFLGNPLDYIGFHKDQIVFYEIKSGQSELSNKQKQIRKLIENKKIKFKELRY
jgi:predicted Holliday junction resolvase-like endonuclease